eukprot:10598614-Karenia_brevis.AAC.1
MTVYRKSLLIDDGSALLGGCKIDTSVTGGVPGEHGVASDEFKGFSNALIKELFIEGRDFMTRSYFNQKARKCSGSSLSRDDLFDKLTACGLWRKGHAAGKAKQPIYPVIGTKYIMKQLFSVRPKIPVTFPEEMDRQRARDLLSTASLTIANIKIVQSATEHIAVESETVKRGVKRERPDQAKAAPSEQ